VYVSIVLCAFLFSLSTESRAREVEERNRIGDWSLFCLKGVNNPALGDCSITTGTLAEADSAVWVRLGFVFVALPYEIAMTIRTPRLNYFTRGILISADGHEIGRAFIDKCGENSCESTISLEPRILRGMAPAKAAVFEYQIGDNESTRLAVNIERLVPALNELRRVVNLVPLVADARDIEGM
jgi:invasion protein IalB